MRCYRSEEKYKFYSADSRFVETWLNMWGKWIVQHNIRSDRQFSNWEEADFCERVSTSVERDFRLTGMGMMTRDLSAFCGFVKLHFELENNILLYPGKRQLLMFYNRTRNVTSNQIFPGILRAIPNTFLYLYFTIKNRNKYVTENLRVVLST